MTSLDRFRALAAPLGVAACVLMSGGCSVLGIPVVLNAPTASRVPIVIDKPGASVVRVSADDDGASIVLAPGQRLSVTLALRITTGEEWLPVDLKPGVLTVLGSKYEPSMRAVEHDAFVGYATWQFKAETPGGVALKFDLRRTHDLSPATRTVSFNVSVK